MSFAPDSGLTFYFYKEVKNLTAVFSRSFDQKWNKSINLTKTLLWKEDKCDNQSNQEKKKKKTLQDHYFSDKKFKTKYKAKLVSFLN